MKLSTHFRQCLCRFAYYYANRTLEFVIEEGGILPNCDYPLELDEIPSNYEQLFIIYSNNIEMDENGMVLNHKYAMTRAAKFIRCCIDSKYEVNPPFEDWELEKH